MNQEPPTPERPEDGTLPEEKEVLSEDDPRIYVASLSDYNAGRLHGAWINANQEPEELQAAITAMLAKSKEPIAEEWAIHDYEGFEPLRLSEYEPIEHVSRIARGIVEHRRAFAHWADYLGSGLWDDSLDNFEDNFIGQWDSTTEFAESFLEDLGVDIDSLVDEQWEPYVSFDVEAFARDLSYDFHIAEDDQGVYVFDNR
jgi:antirestriction protein